MKIDVEKIKKAELEEDEIDEKCKNCPYLCVDDCELLIDSWECTPELIEEMKRLRGDIKKVN